MGANNAAITLDGQTYKIKITYMVNEPRTRQEVSKVVIYHGGKLTEFAAKEKVSYVILYNLLTGRTKYTEKHEKTVGPVLCKVTGLSPKKLMEAMNK